MNFQKSCFLCHRKHVDYAALFNDATHSLSLILVNHLKHEIYLSCVLKISFYLTVNTLHERH